VYESRIPAVAAALDSGRRALGALWAMLDAA
jgi:hypothetical protein